MRSTDYLRIGPERYSQGFCEALELAKPLGKVAQKYGVDGPGRRAVEVEPGSRSVLLGDVDLLDSR